MCEEISSMSAGSLETCEIPGNNSIYVYAAFRVLWEFLLKLKYKLRASACTAICIEWSGESVRNKLRILKRRHWICSMCLTSLVQSKRSGGGEIAKIWIITKTFFRTRSKNSVTACKGGSALSSQIASWFFRNFVGGYRVNIKLGRILKIN